ncbi:MAG: type II toxin-antitoxin system Phd/YefM family antitoxin [Acidimicrobiia bacterium]
MDVGVRELKARLSEYLARAAKGEMIRVTERGVPKAVLGPLPGRARIEAGLAEGWLRPGSGAPPRRVKPHRSTRRIADVLEEDRGP